MKTHVSVVRLPLDLGDRLGMAPGANGRLQLLPKAADPQLVDDAKALELLQFCSVRSDDQEAMLAARPEPDRDPDWWLLVSGCVAELRKQLDKPLPAAGYTAWPLIPEQAGAVGMFAYAWALLTVVPDLLAAHGRRGVPETVTRDTVAALGSVMAAHAEVTGVRGVGLFPLWGPPQRVCGVDVTIGRHDFTRAEIGFGDGVAGWVLQVHMPPTGHLDETESVASIGRGQEFFARHYPDQPISALVCKSWILEPVALAPRLAL